MQFTSLYMETYHEVVFHSTGWFTLLECSLSHRNPNLQSHDRFDLCSQSVCTAAWPKTIILLRTNITFIRLYYNLFHHKIHIMCFHPKSKTEVFSSDRHAWSDGHDSATMKWDPALACLSFYCHLVYTVLASDIDHTKPWQQISSWILSQFASQCFSWQLLYLSISIWYLVLNIFFHCLLFQVKGKIPLGYGYV